MIEESNFNSFIQLNRGFSFIALNKNLNQAFHSDECNLKMQLGRG